MMKYDFYSDELQFIIGTIVGGTTYIYICHTHKGASGSLLDEL